MPRGTTGGIMILGTVGGTKLVEELGQPEGTTRGNQVAVILGREHQVKTQNGREPRYPAVPEAIHLIRPKFPSTYGEAFKDQGS